MTQKIIGAILIVAASGGLGISMAVSYHQKEIMLQQLITGIEFMICELQYRQTALPQVIRQCAGEVTGAVSSVLSSVAVELERQIAPDASCCMAVVLEKESKLPRSVREKLQLLGSSLGRFDLSGQISGLEMVVQMCQRDLNGMMQNRDARLKSYVTLSLCAGAALVILFI